MSDDLDWNINASLGVVEIGAILSMWLFGVNTSQAYTYYQDYPHDRGIFKAIVLTTWLLQLGHVALTWHAVYQLTITYGSDPTRIFFEPPLTLYYTFLFSTCTTTITNSFFAYRVRVFSRKWTIPVVAWFFSFLGLLTSAGILAVLTKYRDDKALVFLQTQYRWLMIILLVFGVVAEGMVTGALVYYLREVRQVTLERTRAIADGLVKWSMQTTLVTTASLALLIVLFLARAPTDLSWMIFYLVQSPLYSISAVVHLNARRRIAPDTNNYIDVVNGYDASLSAMHANSYPGRSAGGTANLARSHTSNTAQPIVIQMTRRVVQNTHFLEHLGQDGELEVEDHSGRDTVQDDDVERKISGVDNPV
ncbi:hypothetical protein HMN09_01308800 [Mycena chlorophos]|uniref:DUF6534 domain-containing protein n=1 Tax=Mycena chlorophos TaxID=658473 RepID=A0A8H6RZX5_MYCCL|nr:hypothetical protein HMN09_01308800 [Mycena chlorophos]